MCYKLKKTSGAEALKKRFHVKTAPEILQETEVSGFEHSAIPIITNDKPDEIQLFHWGLIPSWEKTMDHRKSTLNARIETLREKPSFSESLGRKCLVLVDGFYEYQWLDPAGKNKQKYLITAANNEPFALAGLWRAGLAPNGEWMQTFTIITTEARGIMREIHNSKLRMPVVLQREIEHAWLTTSMRSKVDVDLTATAV